MRAETPFLEYMHVYASCLRQLYCGLVQRPAVAKQNEISYLPFNQPDLKKAGPIFRFATKIDGVWPRPKQSVAAVEVDAVGAMATPR